MFEAQFDRIEKLRAIVEAMICIVDDIGQFKCNEDGITFRAMDKAHNAMIDLKLDQNDSMIFAHYRCDTPTILTFDAVRLFKQISKLAEHGIVTIKKYDSANIMEVHIEEGGLDIQIDVPLVSTGEIEDYTMPTRIYDVEVDLTCERYKRINEHMITLGDADAVTFSVDSNDLTISAAEDSGAKIAYKAKNRTDIQWAWYANSVVERIDISFGAKYLNKFAKAARLSNNVKLGISENTPLSVRFLLSANSHCNYFLAPRDT